MKFTLKFKMVQVQIIPDTEYQRYHQDLEEHPLLMYTGNHKGYKWTMKRVMGHWCGYLHNLTEQEINKMEPHIYGGITGGGTDSIGFDCAHHGDYSVGNIVDLLSKEGMDEKTIDYWKKDHGIYKDYSWVLNHLQVLIDLLN